MRRLKFTVFFHFSIWAVLLFGTLVKNPKVIFPYTVFVRYWSDRARAFSLMNRLCTMHLVYVLAFLVIAAKQDLRSYLRLRGRQESLSSCS
jgi:hypothetical protein